MPVQLSIEFTQLLGVSNALTAARLALVDAEEELRRLAESEMIPVRYRVNWKILSAIEEQLAVITAAMQKASS